MGAANQIAADPSAVAAVENAVQHIQRVGFPGFGGGFQGRRLVTEGHIRQFRRSLDHDAPLAFLRNLAHRAGRGQFAGRQRAKMLFRQRPHLSRIDIADHHQGGVIRRIPLLIPAAQIIGLDRFDVLHPANDRIAIGTGDIGGGLEPLLGQRLRLIFSTQPALFGDHLRFLGDLFRLQQQMAHPVRFQTETEFQPLLFQGLEIGGVVAASESVLVSTISGDQAGKFAARHVGRAFEHQMFQQVGNAGQPARFVAGADLVPDLRDHHRGAMVLAHQHFQAVVQSKFMHRRGGGQRAGAQPDGKNDQAIFTHGNSVISGKVRKRRFRPFGKPAARGFSGAARSAAT